MNLRRVSKLACSQKRLVCIVAWPTFRSTHPLIFQLDSIFLSSWYSEYRMLYVEKSFSYAFHRYSTICGYPFPITLLAAAKKDILKRYPKRPPEQYLIKPFI